MEKEYEYKAKGAQIRSKQEWVEKGEKNTAYFFGLEKSRQTKKTIFKLKNDNGSIITNQTEILNMEKHFYENLYSENNEKNYDDTFEYINKTELQRKLTRKESSVCDGYVTLDELTNAVNNLKLNKSPGIDGLSTNFYRHFWKYLGPVLVKVLNSSYDKQKLPFSQRQSILNLIYKKNDPLDLSNYRPISLLNTDYKILSYTLATRIKKVINLIINSDQTGYIKNRFIGFNLRQIQDIIDYADKFNVNGLILFVDISKAFDTLNWNFMYQSLQCFGFNESFIKWIQTLYNDINSVVTNNGWISAPLKPQRGIRQGCPCSSIIFVIAVEIMATKIRNNKNIKGIEIKLDRKTHSLKISQLADDTTLFLKSKDELKNALNIIKTFSSYSGLKLNKNKTEGIWIGKQKHCKEKVEEIKFTDKPVKVLGLYVGRDKKKCEKLNWESKLEKARILMKSWEKRNLSLLGKILIVKTIIIPQFTFISSVTVTNKTYLDTLERDIYSFIWEGKSDKIKRNTLIAKYEDGGLQMLDIKTYFKMLKIKWVLRLKEATTENWAVIPKIYLNKFGPNCLIFNMNLSKQNIKTLKEVIEIPNFYIETLTSWFELTNKETISTKNYVDIRKQIIWGNKQITYKNKVIFLSRWINSNLTYINDTTDENGNFSEKFILSKLENKSNWIAEFSLIKNAIPKEWMDTLQSEISVKTKVNIKPEELNMDNTSIKMKELNNKNIYDSLINRKTEPNIGIEKWKRVFSCDNYIVRKALEFIHYYLKQNKLKIFRWKLISNILPNGQNLYKWKIISTDLCMLCNTIDNYEHFFMDCIWVKQFWESIYPIFKCIGFTNEISIKHIILGYKISHKNYWKFNLILTIIAFSIYKSFYVSDKKKKKY